MAQYHHYAMSAGPPVWIGKYIWTRAGDPTCAPTVVKLFSILPEERAEVGQLAHEMNRATLRWRAKVSRKKLHVRSCR